MKSIIGQRVRFNTDRMATDAAAKGWNNSRLAEASGVSAMTVGRFMSGEHQTPPTAKKLADALGFNLARYIVKSKPRRRAA